MPLGPGDLSISSSLIIKRPQDLKRPNYINYQQLRGFGTPNFGQFVSIDMNFGLNSPPNWWISGSPHGSSELQGAPGDSLEIHWLHPGRCRRRQVCDLAQLTFLDFVGQKKQYYYNSIYLHTLYHYCTILYYITLYYIILYCIILYYVILYCILYYCII